MRRSVQVSAKDIASIQACNCARRSCSILRSKPTMLQGSSMLGFTDCKSSVARNSRSRLRCMVGSCGRTMGFMPCCLWVHGGGIAMGIRSGQRSVQARECSELQHHLSRILEVAGVRCSSLTVSAHSPAGARRHPPASIAAGDVRSVFAPRNSCICRLGHLQCR